jgi:predicted O-methyltransferase YrrM
MKYFCLFLSVLSSAFANDFQSYKNDVLSKQKNFSFWSLPQKANLIMEFMERTKPRVCVEIGTFTGAMTFPMAKTLSFNRQGMLYSIDTLNYKADETKKSLYNLFANYWHTMDVDGDLIYLDLFARQLSENLKDYLSILRMDSEKASLIFPSESIDFIYFDGDISADKALSDIQTYFPKIKKNGAIWLNRSDLESKHKAVEFLMNNARFEPSWSFGNECVLFIK